MATNTTGSVNTGSGSVATKPQAFYDKTLIKVLRQRQFQHDKLAQMRPMPKRAGDTINFRRIQKLEPALTPLTEGVTPTGESASISAIAATTSQYGSFMEFSDLIDVTQIDPMVTEYTVEQGHQAAETLDVLTRDVLAAGSNAFYANGRTARSGLTAGDIPTINDFRKQVLSMKKNHIRPAANGKYVALVTPEMVYDLMDDAKFEKAYEIGRDNKPFIDGEIADIYGIKFVEVVNGKVFANSGADTNADGTGDYNVHAGILLGSGAYGITKIKGEGDIKTIIKALGSSGTDDPLNQRQTIGWKVNAYVTKRLEELAISRYECIPTNA